jgi:hypothetical protein
VSIVGGSAPEPRDQWAAIAAPGKSNVAAVGLPSTAPRTGIPDKPIHAVVASLFALSAVLQTVWLFVAKLTSASAAPNYRYPQQDASFGVVILLCLAIAVCVAMRASREFGLALALGVAVGILGAFLQDLRPSLYLGSEATSAHELYGASLLCALAGGFTAGLEWRYRSLERSPARKVRVDRRLVRNQRLLCLLAGMFGAVPFVIGSALDYVSVSLQNPEYSFSCCSLAQRTGSEKAEYFGFSAVLVAFVVFAAIDRSPIRSSAWLIGPAVLGLSIAAAPIAEVIWPDASSDGFGAASGTPTQVSPLPGFWLALIGVLVLLAAAAIRARLDRSATATYDTTALSAASA